MPTLQRRGQPLRDLARTERGHLLRQKPHAWSARLDGGRGISRQRHHDGQRGVAKRNGPQVALARQLVGALAQSGGLAGAVVAKQQRAWVAGQDRRERLLHADARAAIRPKRQARAAETEAQQGRALAEDVAGIAMHAGEIPGKVNQAKGLPDEKVRDHGREQGHDDHQYPGQRGHELNLGWVAPDLVQRERECVAREVPERHKGERARSHRKEGRPHVTASSPARRVGWGVRAGAASTRLRHHRITLQPLKPRHTSHRVQRGASSTVETRANRLSNDRVCPGRRQRPLA